VTREREVRSLIEKAHESLDAARLLLQQGYHDFAASRSYYGMFYAAEAVLLDKGLAFSKHAAVIAAFGQHLVATGEFPEDLHRHLLDAFDVRLAADYGAPGVVGEARAREVVDRAAGFVTTVERGLASRGGTDPEQG